MQYIVMSNQEIAHESDDPRGQVPGWYVCEFTEDGGEGRVVAGPFPSHGTAQAKADLMLIGRQKFIEDYVETFLESDHVWTRRQLLRTLRGTTLTETERDSVITEVLEAQDSVATFIAGQALGCFQADEGGCAA